MVPQDADIFAGNLGAGQPAAGRARGQTGLNPFPFTCRATAKLAIEFFAGELGVDCGGGSQGQVGLYIDGALQPAR